MTEILLAEGLTEEAKRMCRPCHRRKKDGSCMFTEIPVEEQNSLAAAGLCDKASLGEGTPSSRQLGPFGWSNVDVPESLANS